MFSEFCESEMGDSDLEAEEVSEVIGEYFLCSVAFLAMLDGYGGGGGTPAVITVGVEVTVGAAEVTEVFNLIDISYDGGGVAEATLGVGDSEILVKAVAVCNTGFCTWVDFTDCTIIGDWALEAQAWRLLEALEDNDEAEGEGEAGCW